MSERSTTACPEDWSAHWQRMLAGASPRQSLPKDRQRIGERAASHSHVDLSVDENLACKLGLLANDLDCSLAELLLASFHGLLFRYTGQEDLFVGWHTDSVPRSGAGAAEQKVVVVKHDPPLVPARVSVSTELRFDDLVRSVRAICRAGWKCFDTSTRGAPAREAVCDLSTEAVPVRFWAAPVLRAEHYGPGEHDACPMPDACKGELGLIAATSDVGLRLRLVYNADRYRAPFIDAMSDHLRRLLESVAANPAVTLSDASLTTPEEEAQLRSWSVGSRVPLLPNLPHVRFQTHAEQTPDKPALVFQGGELTYGELDRRANQLGHLLGGLGVSRDIPVAICLTRSPDVAVAYLGVLKAGGTIFPLAPDAPPAHRRALLDAVSPAVVVTSSSQRALLGQNGRSIVCLDAADPQLATQPTSPPHVSVSPHDVAYLLATSGSTGRPKIVKWSFGFRNPSASISADEHHLLQSSSGTTFTVAEVLRPLVSGGTLFVAPEGLEHDPARLVAFIGQYRISRVLMTPSQLRAVLDVNDLSPCHCLQHVQCSGELVSADLRRRCAERLDAQLLITYGCTEAPSATVRICSPDDEPDSADVGRPAPEMQAFVLDGKGRLSPVGVPGEVFLGGMMSAGYFRDPMGTTERFVVHPFDTSSDARLFRTGDMGRWLPGGRLEILGRCDRQVKIRGFRVELGEIETHLSQHSGVAHGVVVAREDRPGDRRLVAYWVPRAEDTATASSLREHLRQRLPEHMLPSAYVQLEKLPLTPNGKPDYQALLAQAQPDVQSLYVAPRDAVEETLAAVWCEVLGLEQVGIQDNFFDLGGHSLLAARVIDGIERAFGRRIPLNALWFGGGTVANLADLLRAEKRTIAGEVLVEIKPQGRKPVLFVVHTLGGNLFHYDALAQVLDREQPLMGLQARGAYGCEKPRRTIEDIACDCIVGMRECQPRGPYYIAGYSSAGTVAFEIAQQLTASGETVGVLALLDAFAPQARERRTLWQMLGKMRHTRPRMIQEKLYHTVLHRLGLGQWRELRRVGEAQRWAHWSYVTHPYDGPAVLFTAKASSNTFDDPALGWGQLVLGNLRVYSFDADHSSLMQSPIVSELAAKLQIELDAAARR